MEKTVFEMTQQELIELNTQYLKRIQELEKENRELALKLTYHMEKKP